MTGESLDIHQNQIDKLKQLFPETITEGKIDWEKLQASLGKENIEFSNERYVLNWAGKSEAFKVLQQSTTATLKPVPEESINFDTTENVFIEGENLEVLKVLQKSYYNKIKCIIIDPPYDKRGPWRSADLTGLLTRDQRPNCHYDLINPDTNLVYKCPPKGWRFEPKTMDLKIKERRILWPETSEGRPRHKLFMNEMESLKKNMSSLITTVSTLDGSKELANIFGPGIFSFPKPHKLTKILLDQVIMDDDIILDFFAGSGTTAQAVLELNKEDSINRKFILVQLPEICNENSEAYKAGYKTIADISKERIRWVIKKIQNEDEEIKKKKESELQLIHHDLQQNMDLGFKSFKLSSSNFKIWRGNDITEDNLETQLDAFTDPVREGSETENMLYELILKAGYLLTDKVEKQNLDVISTSLNDQVSLDDQTQTYNGNYYSVKEGELIIALDAMNQQLIDTIISAKPKKVITLDKLFEGNDQLKTNAVLQMQDADIDFKTI